MTWWNSIESLRHISLILVWAAVLLAVASAGATWLRYYVDRRIGDLSSQAQEVREEERRRRQEATEQELQDLRSSDEENRSRHQRAEEELASLRSKAAPRTLPSDARQALAAFLQGKPKGSVVIKAAVTAPDARGYAEEVRAVLAQAGWKVRIDNAMFTEAKGQVLLIYIRDKIHYEPSNQKRIVILNAKTSLTRNFIFRECISEKTPAPVFPPNDVHESVVIKVSAVRFNARVPPELLQSKIPAGGSAV